MRRRTAATWTEREDALLCKLRARDQSLEELAARFPARTQVAIGHRLRQLAARGLAQPLGEPWWTTKEDELLCKLRAQGKSLDDIAPQLPHRTPKAVSGRIRQLLREGRIERLRGSGAKQRRWTAREDALLVKLRGRGATLPEMASEFPHRSSMAIALRVQRLADEGLIERRGPKSRKSWGPDDDRKLEQMRRAGRTMLEIAAALDRSLPSINGRIAEKVRKGELSLLVK